MEVSWQFAFMSLSNTASVLLQCELNILDVTQLGRTHTQQLAAKCRAEANISSRISDDTGQGAGGGLLKGTMTERQIKPLTLNFLWLRVNFTQHRKEDNTRINSNY